METCSLSYTMLKQTMAENDSLDKLRIKCNASHNVYNLNVSGYVYKNGNNSSYTDYCDISGNRVSNKTGLTTQSTQDITNKMDINAATINKCFQFGNVELAATIKDKQGVDSSYDILKTDRMQMDKSLQEITDNRDTSNLQQSLQSVQSSVYASLLLAGIASGLLVYSFVTQL